MQNPFDISLDTANQFYSWGWKASLAGALVTLLGVSLLFWGTRVRDHDFEGRVAQLNRDAAADRERAAKQELETTRLKAELAPRRLKREEFLKMLHGVPKAPIEIMYVRDDSESMEFAQEINIFLEQGGWQVISRAPIPLPKIDKELPSAMTVGGQPTGVTIVANAQDVPKISQPNLLDPAKDMPTNPFESLNRALLVGIGQLGTHIGGDSVPPKGTLRIVVSPKRPPNP